MNFDVLIDDSLLALAPDFGQTPATNKSVLSLVNDFEDGAWRYSKFLRFVWDNVALTCLSQRERLALVGSSHGQLVESAARLRLSDNPNAPTEGSELAEVVLYGIMQKHFGALPVVPKIFYKQNSQDNAKGSDSVHVVVHGTDFSLWLGEAKFYRSIADARLPAIVASVAEMLSSDKLRKETSIITSLTELEALTLQPDILHSIRAALDSRHSLDDLKPRLHIPILLLHECELTSSATVMTPEYREALAANHKDRAIAYFSKQISAIGSSHLYGAVQFHVILFPVPSKEEVVRRYLDAVAFYQDQR